MNMVFSANLTYRRHMTIWIGHFFSQLCRKWVLGRNGLGGSSGAFPLQVSLCWLMAPLWVLLDSVQLFQLFTLPFLSLLYCGSH